ncbi:hypothetical protein ACWD1W_30435 [Streptomyces olivaceoviridis]
MDASQVPQPNGGSAPGRDGARGPETPAPSDGDSALWNEALPWVDDVSGAEGVFSTAPDDPQDGPAHAPEEPGPARAARRSRPARPTSPTGDDGHPGDRTSRRRRGPVALGAGIAGTGALAIAMILTTQHGGDDRAAAASVVRADPDGPSPDRSGGRTPNASVSPGRSPSSAPAGPTPAGGGRALSASPFPGATSAPAAAADDPHSSGPHTAPPAHSTPRTPTTTAVPVRSPKVIRATAVLNPGQSVPWGKATLAMTPGGDLVVTDERGVTRWASHTSGSDLQTVFQDDGCMAVYDPGGTVHWSSYTNGHPGAVLVITGDGNVQIKLGDTVLWQTGTGH